MRTEHCAQAVTYLSYCQYTEHRSIILGVKVPREYVAPVAYEHCQCSVGRMDAASIVSGNVWGCFMSAGIKGSMHIFLFCQSSVGTLTAIR